MDSKSVAAVVGIVLIAGVLLLCQGFGELALH